MGADGENVLGTVVATCVPLQADSVNNTRAVAQLKFLGMQCKLMSPPWSANGQTTMR